MADPLLSLAGFAFVLVGVTCAAVPAWRSLRRVTGWTALAGVFYFVGDFLPPSPLRASIDGAVATVNAWIWWNSGGGDGTRRRLKSWARRFRGVRRTAPALGGA